MLQLIFSQWVANEYGVAYIDFVKDNKVVYEESYAASIEESAKFNISVSPSLDYYCILPYDDSFAFVTKEKHKSSTCYSLIIYPKNKMN